MTLSLANIAQFVSDKQQPYDTRDEEKTYWASTNEAEISAFRNYS